VKERKIMKNKLREIRFNCWFGLSLAIIPLTAACGLLVVTVAAPSLVKAQNVGAGVMSACTNATVKGAYGFQRNGTTSHGPLTAVGIAVFDGQGNVVAQQTISRSGIFEDVTDQVATYNINPDCTGTLTDPTSGNVFAKLVVDHNGSEILGMSLTPGNNVAIHYERIIDLLGSVPVGVK
jgi:hypothetical protein